MDIVLIGGFGYMTAWIGFFIGVILTAFIKKADGRLLGSMMGFTAGLLLAFICFEMLPGALENFGLYQGIGVLLLGVLASSWLEGHMNGLSALRRASLILIIGISVHNIPEGMALGSIMKASTVNGFSFAIMIAAHGVPAALAMALPMKQDGANLITLILLSFLLSLPMGAGAMAGAFFSSISPYFLDGCVCFAGGVMLYISCGEIIPESKELWKGRLPALCSMIGFALGIWLSEKL
ncbi:MAG: ZIP family metal transporter [Clostridiales bacterium]|jgi:ZIP family zinc transporter|nr:ZIP family metal transporter [Clostridiales bacterium]